MNFQNKKFPSLREIILILNFNCHVVNLNLPGGSKFEICCHVVNFVKPF